MKKLKDSFKHLKQALADELDDVKLLKGDKLNKLKDHFYFEDINVYYNEYNLVFISENDLDKFRPYLKSEDMVVEVNIPKSNTFIAVYHYFNNAVLESYLE